MTAELIENMIQSITDMIGGKKTIIDNTQRNELLLEMLVFKWRMGKTYSLRTNNELPGLWGYLGGGNCHLEAVYNTNSDHTSSQLLKVTTLCRSNQTCHQGRKIYTCYTQYQQILSMLIISYIIKISSSTFYGLTKDDRSSKMLYDILKVEKHEKNSRSIPPIEWQTINIDTKTTRRQDFV